MDVLDGLQEGIIPAGAGKSLVSLLGLRPGGDHPRGCGEETNPYADIPCVWESSPRVRGRDAIADEAKKRGRIIPAGAGKS